MPSKLGKDYPWTTGPIILNAPMAGIAGAPLATAVSQAGGIGMIGADMDQDMEQLESHLASAKSTFFSPSPPSTHTSTSTAASFLKDTNTLPLGVGLLVFLLSPDAVLPVLKRHPPALVWLFAAREFGDYGTWAQALRAACPDTKIWIQTGSASAALEIARVCAPDVLVLQGADAGGHGFARGAGVISLLPEARDLLAAHGLSRVSLVAAGGIADGRGVAAALALGAEAVAMGTRFLGAEETQVHPAFRAAVLGARDGALSTVRAGVFDELRGPSIWPGLYDGRALATESYADWRRGVDIESIRERYKEAVAGEDAGYKSRAAVWAGTGVGLVNEVKSAATIVEGIREAARTALGVALSSI
ncbi:inosine monophosphate dehydrogenase [Xylariaceae sp. FL1651]|nr:inosine monophosphate dehydrogenase [Xylariaceae sp. FL1651]